MSREVDPRNRRFVDGEEYELIGTDERVDRDWEDRNAEQKRKDWEGAELERAERRRAARGQRPLDERLRDVVREIRSLSGGSVRDYERAGAKGGEARQIPVGGAPLDVDRHLRVIESRVRLLEEELDAYLGLSDPRPVVLMSAKEKDALICSARFEGMRPEDVHEAAPYLGSARTIRRARAKQGLRGVDGRPRSSDMSEERAA